jgi:dTDP-4-amino-4,6-dideoxygalactose transaminase
MTTGKVEVPFGDLRRESDTLHDEIHAAIERVLRRGWFILGEELAAFEAEYAAYCGADHAVGVGNGTDALQLILEAAGIGPGDEVITSPLTATFTALAIARAGARCVFADVEPDGLTLDPAAARAAITARTAALMPVHLYGQPADMEALAELARQHGLLLVEDACQAHGARFQGRRTGSQLPARARHAAAFSFYPSKNLGAYGDGGMVVTSHADLAGRVRILRHGGQTRRYQHDLLGTNSRLDELQAAILRVKLPHLDAWNRRRRQIAGAYSAGLAGTSLILPVELPGREHAWHLYVVRSGQRDELRQVLAERGVGTEVHYPIPAHLQAAFAHLGYSPGTLPVAERAAAQVFSLPMYPYLTDAEAAQVVGQVRDALEHPPSVPPAAAGGREDSP